ncbi:hypothetical protein [Agathobaculum sp.]|uniref:hypothetical protein n=1 Tax=Agathobaculum sp. TaxID=2048138 RepID=UPI003A91C4BF
MDEYIDRANLIARIEYYVTHTPEGKGEHYAYSVVLNEVLNRPAADVVPVVHGRWIQVDSTKCRCSHCDIIALIALYPHGDKNFCPNCGAKMDRGAE